MNYTLNIRSKVHKVTFFFICLGAIAFPFSIAATNASLGLALILSVFSGQLFQGIKLLYQKQPIFFYALGAYIFLVIIGLAWSGDREHGMEYVSRLHKWLLLPLLLASLITSKRYAYIFMGAISLGLTLHLGACVAQSLGWLLVTSVGGSQQQDATGYIGHIAFGSVYVIWAGWLIFWGHQQQENIYKISAWVLAAWAFTMVFLAQGRSGYLLGVSILLYVLWYIFMQHRSWKIKLGFVSCLLLVLFFTVSSIDITKNKQINQTWNSIESVYHGDISKAEARIRLWLIGLDIWEHNPIFGAGTGGYRADSIDTQIRHPEYFKNISVPVTHPHQLYLQYSAGYGVVGLLILFFLLWAWLRSVRIDMSSNIFSPLATLSALTIIIHGFTSVGISAFHPLTMAIFALALAMAHHKPTKLS